MGQDPGGDREDQGRNGDDPSDPAESRAANDHSYDRQKSDHTESAEENGSVVDAFHRHIEDQTYQLGSEQEGGRMAAGNRCPG